MLESLAGFARAPETEATAILRRGHTRVTAHVPDLGIVKFKQSVRVRQILASVATPVGFAREFDLAVEASRRGVVASRPLFVAELRRFAVPRSTAIVYEPVPDAPNLAAVLDAHTPAPGRRRMPRDRLGLVLSAAGRLVASLHKAGGLHGDLSASNILVPPSSDPVLIDWLSASFVDHRLARTRVGQYIADTESALRFNPRMPRHARKEFWAARDGFTREGHASTAFQRLSHRDLARFLMSLLCCRASVRQTLRVLRSYVAHLGLSRAHYRDLAAELLEDCTRKMRRTAARAAARAERETRAIGVRRDGHRVVCWRHEDDDAAAMVDRGRPCPRARDGWRNACALTIIGAPAAPCLATSFDARTGEGRLLSETPELPHRAPMLHAEDSVERLGAFVRLVHSLGFRFHTCADGTLERQADALGPFTVRGGSGYVLADPTAVTFAPETPCSESLETVGEWAERLRPGAKSLLRQAGEPPRRIRL